MWFHNSLSGKWALYNQKLYALIPKSLHKCVFPTHDGEFHQHKSTINEDSNLFLSLVKEMLGKTKKEMLASTVTIMT